MLSGTGRSADAWHPFAWTSARLAAILRDQGFAPEIAGPHERMADLGDTRLVVLRRARPRRTVLRLPEHREIIARAARWLVADLAE